MRPNLILGLASLVLFLVGTTNAERPDRKDRRATNAAVAGALVLGATAFLPTADAC